MKAFLLALGWMGAAALALGENPAEGLQGTYQSISDQTVLRGNLKNSGSPAAIPLLAAASQKQKPGDFKDDPWKTCQPVGPFRMMAKPQTKIEIVPTKDIVMILFEDAAHGVMRPVYMTHGHPQNLELTWMGHSTGSWENDAFVIDTIGFNDRTWLNDQGAQHSPELHLVERIRPVLNGEYLEYKMTATDPKALARPYTYVRYFEKLSGELREDTCRDER